MRAVQANGNGLTDAKLIKIEPKSPEAGQLRLDLLAMTINPADLLMLESKYGVKPRNAFIPGAEAVARVAEIGADVEGFDVGDLVIPMPGSCWVETMTLPAKQVIKLPKDADLEQAAMLKANPATASVMLRDICDLQSGDWVVLNAANSAVGQNVIRIAAKRGINVLSIVRSDAAAAQARAAGATHVVIDDGSKASIQSDAPLAKLAFDAIGGTATERLGARVEDGGTVVTYGLLSGQAPRLSSHDLVFRGLFLRGFWLASWFGQTHPKVISDTYGELTKWLSEGTIGAPVAATYDIGDFETAIQHAAKEERGGKILLTGSGWQK
mgnify:CR=1 FL=1